MLFRSAPVELELGAGDGSFLLQYSAAHPEVDFLGVERLFGRLRKIDRKGRRQGLKNLRGLRMEATYLMDWMIAPASLSAIHVYFPDPWPKARHHRRRFVTQDHLEPLFGVMRSGGEFRVATDIEDYVRQTLQEVPKAGFEWTAEGPSDWREPWGDWHSTRYEQKALREGRTPHYLTFRKP